MVGKLRLSKVRLSKVRLFRTPYFLQLQFMERGKRGLNGAVALQLAALAPNSDLASASNPKAEEEIAKVWKSKMLRVQLEPIVQVGLNKIKPTRLNLT